jgi:hypothetical protein
VRVILRTGKRTAISLPAWLALPIWMVWAVLLATIVILAWTVVAIGWCVVQLVRLGATAWRAR